MPTALSTITAKEASQSALRPEITPIHIVAIAMMFSAINAMSTIFRVCPDTLAPSVHVQRDHR